jgi:hypothetical protein
LERALTAKSAANLRSEFGILHKKSRGQVIAGFITGEAVASGVRRKLGQLSIFANAMKT